MDFVVVVVVMVIVGVEDQDSYCGCFVAAAVDAVDDEPLVVDDSQHRH